MRTALAYVRSQGDRVDPVLHLTTTGDLGSAIAYQIPGHPEAIAFMRESIEVGDRNRLNPAGAAVMHNLGLQLIRLGRIEDAEATLHDSLRRMEALPSPPPERYSALRSLATILLQRGQNTEAERLAAEAAEGNARTRPGHPLQPNFDAWRGRALVATGQLQRGRTVLLEAYTGYTKIRPPGHMELAMPLVGLGAAYRLEGRLHEAELALREARAILRRHPAQKERGAEAAGELGLTLHAMGMTTEADTLLRESHETLYTAFGEAHPLTKQALARVSGERR